MSAEYSVEEVRAQAKICGNQVEHWQRSISEEMLTAYANRIESDESAAIGEMRENGVTWFRANPHAFPIGTRFYTASPAQAAQPVAFKHPAAVRSASAFLLAKFEHAPCDGSGVSCCVRCSAVAMSRWAIEALDASTDAHPHSPDAADSGRVDADELIAAYDDAVRSQRESGFLPPLAQQAARDCVEHNRNRLRKAITAALAAQGQGEADELFNTFRLAYYGANKSLAPELESFRRAYKAIVRPSSPTGVPDGWVPVPREPTPQMLAAVEGSTCSVRVAEDDYIEYPFSVDECAEIYRNMLAAAPSAPEGGEVDRG